MKRYPALSVFVFFSLQCFGMPLSSYALDIVPSPSMQSCSSDADCTVVDGQCGNACSFLPVNVSSSAALQQQKLSRCGASATDEPACRTQPALTASCIHNRCTIATAYQEHGDRKDYNAPIVQGQNVQNGNKDHGFTAYDLPDHGAATSRELGTATAR